MTSHWKAILGVIMIFVLGFASGIVCSSIVVHRKMTNFLQHPAATAAKALEKQLTQNLALDHNQEQQIHGYFLAALQQRRELERQIQPQLQVLNRQTLQQINATLRPDQQERFHQNIEAFRNRFSKVAATADGEAMSPLGAQPVGPATNSGAASPAPQH